MRRGRRHHAARATRALLLAGVVLAVAAPPARAQYFGRNKVQYERFDFRTFSTEHFDVYFYPRERAAAEMAGRMAERWYARHSRWMDHELDGRQPLILYASHPQFRQTNVISGMVGEGTGGVTEALKRRIVMPLAGPLGATDHVIGHEIVHAFQFDMIGGGGLSLGAGGIRLPLWFVEGMAEYASIGPEDAHTAMWMRDAVATDRLPTLDDLANPQSYFPYRYGHALIAYLAGRFGDDAVVAMLTEAGRAGNVRRAMNALFEVSADSVVTDWHRATRELYEPIRARTTPADSIAAPLTGEAAEAGELNVAPALSPDGRRIAFFSERDLFAVNLVLADTETGEILGSITRAERDPHLESLQFIRSSGAWNATGDRFVYAAIVSGRPELDIYDVTDASVETTVRFDTLGEILNPTWSPDGRRIAFSAVESGFTDLYLYDLESETLERLTHDAFSDLQPVWSPNGRWLAFVTDRFTTDLERLDIGEYRLALFDVERAEIRPVDAFESGKHIDPDWSPDGRSLYFVSDHDGISNVHRVDLETGELARLTNVFTGVSGITETSPALAVAARTGRLAFSVFDDGAYRLYLVDDPDAIAAPYDEPVSPPPARARELPPIDEGRSEVATLLDDPRVGLPAEIDPDPRPYDGSLSLDYIGDLQLAAGTGRFGTILGGGASLFFSDMLGHRNLITALQVQSDGVFSDLAFLVAYENSRRRWDFGAALQQTPYSFSRVSLGRAVIDSTEAFVERELRERQTTREAILFTAYPRSEASRVEVNAGYQNVAFDEKLVTRAVAVRSGEVLVDETEELPSPDPLHLGVGGAALVYDNAYFGAASPILGQRYRFELSGVAGTLRHYQVLADYRRYFLPLRPFTIALRGLHVGRYGEDAEDERLLDLFIGYQSLVRGYPSTSFDVAECPPGEDCASFDRLFGSRIAVANAELRFPPLGLLGLGSDYYGALPLEAALFYDAGAAWNRNDEPEFLGGDREVVSSYGAALRLGLLGLIVLQLDYVNPVDRPQKGWFWQFSISPGF